MQISGRHLTSAEAARFVRRALREAFPDASFRVRSKGSIIDVAWTGGPDRDVVAPIAAVLTRCAGAMRLADAPKPTRPAPALRLVAAANPAA